MRKCQTIIALSTLLLTSAAGCRDAPTSPPRLVLLYAPCTVNKQFLAPWNEQVAFTPKIAEFATQSTVFLRHQTEAGQSGISYASLFSGSQADHHHVYRHPATVDDELFLVAEAYAEAGYETYFWNGHDMTGEGLNYDQGVEDANHFAKRLNAEDPRFVEVMDRLARDPNYKAFIVTNFSVSHGPYPKENVGRFLRDYPNETLGVTKLDVRKYADLYRRNYLGLTWNHEATLERIGVMDDLQKFVDVVEVLYRANLNHLDRLFGGVLDALNERGLFDESLVVFTADHGEVMYRESATFQWTHSMILDHEVIGIPLIIHAPALARAGATYTKVTRSIDVFPTMLGLSGILLPPERGVQGVDLASRIRGDDAPPGLRAFSHTTVLVETVFEQMYDEAHADSWMKARGLFPNDEVDQIWVAVRDGDRWFKRRKLFSGEWATQAFDLAVDPDALHDIFDPTIEQHAELQGALSEYKAMLVRNYRTRSGEVIDNALPRAREEELLRGLGYIE